MKILTNSLKSAIFSSFFLFIIYLISHLAVDLLDVNIHLITILIYLFSNNIIFSFLKSLSESNIRKESTLKMTNIILNGLLGFGLNWYIIMSDLMTTDIKFSILISLLCGLTFSLIMSTLPILFKKWY